MSVRWIAACFFVAIAIVAQANGPEPPEPSFPQFARLKALLVQYDALSAQAWPALPPLPARGKVERGDPYAGAQLLGDRLRKLGDLASDAPRGDDDRYGPELADAVRRFQSRHGLLVDGILGRETSAALDVPPSRRRDQIALAMQRIRALPALPPGPFIVVNIPSFQLAVFADPRDTERPVLSMPVVVGKAVRNETPVFIGEMKYVEFGPYWNVPASILRKEILPRLARDPDYLAREDMEIVSAKRPAAPLAMDESGIAALRSGEARLRQRPGARNSVGGVKFGLPNKMDIYLHATPATELFARARRDFSHGCIRVRDPAALAQFVLAGRAEWTPEAIEAAVTAYENRTVPLTKAIPVVVFYTTAFVDAEGHPHFLPDIYGHDRKALAAASRG